jgi:hypothetical protein
MSRQRPETGHRKSQGFPRRMGRGPLGRHRTGGENPATLPVFLLMRADSGIIH